MVITTILFDLDNTLIDRQKAFKEMLKERLSMYHKNLTNDEFDKIVNEIVAWDNNGNTDRLIVFDKYIEKYGVPVSAEELNDYWKNNSGSIVYEFEDAKEVLCYLKDKYRLGIVSNGNAISQRRKMSHLSFFDMFEYTLVSGETDYNKPDIRLFNKVCDDLGVVSSECVFVGDNYRCDIEGSYGAGMKAIWITNSEETSEICTIIRTLSDLKNIL